MQCPASEDIKSEKFDVINSVDDEHVKTIMLDQQELFYILTGKHPPELPFESMSKILVISSRYRYISRMYRHRINNHIH